MEDNYLFSLGAIKIVYLQEILQKSGQDSCLMNKTRCRGNFYHRTFASNNGAELWLHQYFIVDGFDFGFGVLVLVFSMGKFQSGK